MGVTFELENDELAALFFYIQSAGNSHEDPLMEKILLKLESLIYSRFSIDEVEQYKNRVLKKSPMGDKA